MRILHVITSLMTGGAEHLLVDLLPRLRDMGNQVDLCVLCGIRTPFYQELEKEGIKIIPLCMDTNPYQLSFIPKLRKIMTGYDIVHTHITAPQYFAAIAKKKGMKLVTTEHATSNRRRNNPIFKIIDKWIYRRYDKIISISEPCEENLRKNIGDNYPFCIIKNGINIMRFMNAYPANLHIEAEYLITMVAGFRYEKDQATVIRSLKHLPDTYHLALVGTGTKLSEMEHLAKEEGVHKRVHFLGIRTDIAAILKASDVVVMSSHREGLSLSNLEGMASGKPFVASDVEGLREVTKGYGVLFPHSDDKALADIVIKLTTNQVFCKEVVDKCCERAMQYDIKITAEQYNNIYTQLI